MNVMSDDEALTSAAMLMMAVYKPTTYEGFGTPELQEGNAVRNGAMEAAETTQKQASR
jgi:hypothetical protein